jgi:uncharacterized coiled-coil protein SlyX
MKTQDQVLAELNSQIQTMLAETNAMNAKLAGLEKKVEQLEASTSGIVRAVGEAVGPCDPK